MNDEEREKHLDQLLLLTERALIALVVFLEHQEQKAKTYPKTVGVAVKLSQN